MTDESGDLSNLDQVVDVLRYCRNHNIIFDCDSVLRRGRGISCGLCTEDQQLKIKLLELQRIDREEFGNDWEITQSYVGGPACDRHFHHLYITQYGEILPCIGATGVHLGNVRTTSLEQAWNSEEMKIIRARRYGGKCGIECANFAEGKCNSCLGRRAVNLTNDFLLSHGYVDTIGCWNFRKKNK
jgi:MoaA/NifB/PqqE/SkfB family radical SAM enzyme